MLSDDEKSTAQRLWEINQRRAALTSEVRKIDMERRSIEKKHGEGMLFWQRVSVGKDEDCWPYRGARDGAGYGVVFRGRWGTSKASRLAYMIVHGPIADGFVVCHSCDNPCCCNPRHLWLGTQSENMKDALSKGRLVAPILKKEMAARGEAHGRATITSKQAKLIATSPKSPGELALELAISTHVVNDVRTGQTWSHVTGIERRKIGPCRKSHYRPVEIRGVIYPSIKGACRETGETETMVRYRLKKGFSGYRFVSLDEFYRATGSGSPAIIINAA